MTSVSDLRKLLEAYVAPAEEAQSVAATMRLLDEKVDPLSADHFVPGHVTASAFVVDRSHTRLLLIHHGKLHLWLQPGGHVDPGEDVLTAAIREVQEETGVIGVPIDAGVFDVDVHPIPSSGGRPAHNHYDVRFLLEATSEELVDSDEVLGVRWVPFGEVGEIVTDSSVLRATEKLLARWV
ncbi:MAG: NUDIX hydrolase [Actinomycetota bacterium]|nr:NUDIX hydrolase [Actinomycetota bacterium]